METIRKYQRLVSFFIGFVFLAFETWLWYFLSFLPLWERSWVMIISCILLIILGNYIVRKYPIIFTEVEMEEERLVITIDDLKEKYDVFLSFYSGGGERYATHIWKKLQDQGFTPFLSVMDIPKSVNKDSEEYRNIIDEGILRSHNFVLIMTSGFSTRPEIIRELEFARKNNVDRLFYKHNKLSYSELKIILSDGILDISRGECTSFENESDLFNELYFVLSGEDNIIDEKYTVSEREVMTKILRPIYNDVDIIVRDINELYRHNFEVWDDIGLNERYLWHKYNNENIKSKIEELYSIMIKRNDDLGIYIERINRIINSNVMELLEEKKLKYVDDPNVILLNTKASIIYKNNRRGTGRSLLAQDVLLKGLGKSLMLDPNIESAYVMDIFLNLAGGKPYEPTGAEIRKLWDSILEDANRDESVVFLRKSVENIIVLGSEILQLIGEL